MIVAREKGATTTDKAAHRLFDTCLVDVIVPVHCRECGAALGVAYHEERLYSVRCCTCKTVALVKAGNPTKAAYIIGEPIHPDRRP